MKVTSRILDVFATKFHVTLRIFQVIKLTVTRLSSEFFSNTVFHKRKKKLK